MNYFKMLKSLFLPTWLKKIIRSQTFTSKVSRIVSQYMPPIVCVDIGASYFLHAKWKIFLNSTNTYWLVVEPNEENITYTKAWSWRSKLHICRFGLSHDGGEKTLYVTNVDSGSSLLPPEIHESMAHRIEKLDYFFPVTEKVITTLTLVEAIKGCPKNSPVFLKLDTQGTELSILSGAQGLFNAGRIVGIEIESTLLSQPVMKGSGKFWEVCQYLEAQGFELLDLKLIRVGFQPNQSKLNQLNSFLNECDAVFILRRDVAAKLPVDYRLALLCFYFSNQLASEAKSLLMQDSELLHYLDGRGCNVRNLLDICK